ncbi:hypothetical protein GPECTOR_57g484 [Gonium pectorale]|uniref:Uncharacterized protein n=1 Tax=Gonium pectorale TaxID=33097 RepID=A0A150G5U7_GONPE|nr:hypothetical protein GPECTOR_57g484 [Gonium pectorale]|eukprot:KXZ45194.1 hypothetical protein GPECTOR_57g484 [Gonium pectorale]
MPRGETIPSLESNHKGKQKGSVWRRLAATLGCVPVFVPEPHVAESAVRKHKNEAFEPIPTVADANLQQAPQTPRVGGPSSAASFSKFRTSSRHGGSPTRSAQSSHLHGPHLSPQHPHSSKAQHAHVHVEDEGEPPLEPGLGLSHSQIMASMDSCSQRLTRNSASASQRIASGSVSLVGGGGAGGGGPASAAGGAARAMLGMLREVAGAEEGVLAAALAAGALDSNASIATDGSTSARSRRNLHPQQAQQHRTASHKDPFHRVRSSHRQRRPSVNSYGNAAVTGAAATGGGGACGDRAAGCGRVMGRRHSMAVADRHASYSAYEAYHIDADHLMLLKRVSSRTSRPSGGQSFVLMASPRARRQSMGPFVYAGAGAEAVLVDEFAPAHGYPQLARLRTHSQASRGGRASQRQTGYRSNAAEYYDDDGGQSALHADEGASSYLCAAYGNAPTRLSSHQQVAHPQLPDALSLLADGARPSSRSQSHAYAAAVAAAPTGHSPRAHAYPEPSQRTPVKSRGNTEFAAGGGAGGGAMTRSPSASPWDAAEGAGGVAQRTASTLSAAHQAALAAHLRASSVTSPRGLPLMSTCMLGRKNAAAAAHCAGGGGAGAGALRSGHGGHQWGGVTADGMAVAGGRSGSVTMRGSGGFAI